MIANKVIAQIESDKLRPGFFDATDRPDGPDYVGRTYTPGTDTFSAPVVDPPSARQVLADKAVWSQADRDLAQRIFLDPSKGG